MKVHSHTSLSTFKQCPLKYKYRYIDHIKPEIVFIEAFMGKCVHEIMETFYGRLAEDHGEWDLDDHLCYFDHIWKFGIHPGVRLAVKGQSIDQYRKVGERCITNYFNRYVPFDQSETLGVELKVELPEIMKEHSIVGYIDRLSYSPEGNGVLEIHDYKTSKHLPSKKELLKDQQLSLYQVAIGGTYPDAERIELVWHYLYHDRELRLTRTVEELNQIMDGVLYTIDKIEMEKGFEPRPGFLCRWCSYQYLCPKRKDKCEPEAMPFPELRKAVKYLEERIERLIVEVEQNPDTGKKRELDYLTGTKKKYKAILERGDSR